MQQVLLCLTERLACRQGMRDGVIRACHASICSEQAVQHVLGRHLKSYSLKDRAMMLPSWSQHALQPDCVLLLQSQKRHHSRSGTPSALATRALQHVMRQLSHLQPLMR